MVMVRIKDRLACSRCRSVEAPTLSPTKCYNFLSSNLIYNGLHFLYILGDHHFWKVLSIYLYIYIYVHALVVAHYPSYTILSQLSSLIELKYINNLPIGTSTFQVYKPELFFDAILYGKSINFLE